LTFFELNRKSLPIRKNIKWMRGGPLYDSAKGQPRPLSGPDFFGQKTWNPVGSDGEPEKSGTESSVTV